MGNQSEFTCIFDTGSAFVWVPSIECHDCHNPFNGFNRHQCFKDNGCENFANKMSIHYGKGDVSGHFVKDYVELENGMTFKQHILAAKTDGHLRGIKGDGVCGMAFS